MLEELPVAILRCGLREVPENAEYLLKVSIDVEAFCVIKRDYPAVSTNHLQRYVKEVELKN